MTPAEGGKRTVWKSQKYIKTAVTSPSTPPSPVSAAPTHQGKGHSGQGDGGAQLQARIGGRVPAAWERKAANSLYRVDATVDEGAAGRSEVQEGQAGCSGWSGLATGTENRREMKRVKRRRGTTAGEGRREPEVTG